MRTVDEPRTGSAPAWGWADVAACFAFALVVQALAFSVYLAIEDLPTDTDAGDLSIGVTVLLAVPIWLGYLGGSILATIRRGNGPVEDLGLRMRWTDAPIGLFVGVVCQFVLVPVVSWPLFTLGDVDPDDLEEAARALVDRADGATGTMLLVFMVVVMAPLAEEVFFRGLLQRTMARTLLVPEAGRAGPVLLVVGNGLLFGITHLQLLQLPALTAFGIVLSVLALRSGRLGLAIWAHVGFNATTVVTLLVT